MRLRGLLVSCVVALLAPAAFASSASAQAASLPAVGPACDEATLGPDEKVLVFTKVAGFPHDSRPADTRAARATAA